MDGPSAHKISGADDKGVIVGVKGLDFVPDKPGVGRDPVTIDENVGNTVIVSVGVGFGSYVGIKSTLPE